MGKGQKRERGRRKSNTEMLVWQRKGKALQESISKPSKKARGGWKRKNWRGKGIAGFLTGTKVRKRFGGRGEVAKRTEGETSPKAELAKNPNKTADGKKLKRNIGEKKMCRLLSWLHKPKACI